MNVDFGICEYMWYVCLYTYTHICVDVGIDIFRRQLRRYRCVGVCVYMCIGVLVYVFICVLV